MSKTPKPFSIKKGNLVINRDERYKQGFFTPVNKNKCLNKEGFCIYRSALEMKLMINLDKNPNILEWSSEATIIPYDNPVSGNVNRYFVDFYMKVQTPNGIKKFLVEVKPARQTVAPLNSSKAKPSTKAYAAMQYAINTAKWESAKNYCKKKGMEFKILTEEHIENFNVIN